MKALIYYRMSSDQQTDSIDRQKAEVEPVVEKEGDEIEAVFIDRGKSGSKNRAKRKDFLRMMEFIRNGCEARKLYLWDLARFTRENPFKAAEFYGLLMDKGIVIHDCKSGEFDLSTQTGRMIVNMMQEMNHRFSTDLSENTTSGRRQLLKLGWWVAGAIPYGYQRMYVGPGGDTVLRPRNDSGYKKPRGYHLALSIVGEEAANVREMYRKYLDEDTSLRAIARWLNDLGVVPPSGDPAIGWNNGSVANILDNKAYCGYSHIGGGHRRYRDKEVFGRVGDNEVKSDKVPAIVSEDDWQSTFEKREESKAKHRVPKPDQHGRLSGVLYCGHCGYSLDKAERRNKDRHPYIYYSCQSGAKYPGKCECRQWRVLEKDMLPMVLDKLFDGIDASIQDVEVTKRIDSLEDGKADRLAERLRDVEASITRANRRFLKASNLSSQMEADLGEIISELESEKVQIEKQIRSVKVIGASDTTIKEGLKTLRSMMCVGLTEEDEIVLSRPNANGKRSMTVKFKEGPSDRKPLFYVPIVSKDEIRAFLKKLGVKVFVYWQPRARVNKRGGILRDEAEEIVRSRRNFEVEKVHLRADFRPEKVLSMGSNKHTRERILDTD
ncbi:hypothetical protein KOR42_28630 [Thalassoglobus neptunius]|uniref:Recombinase n=1 Tax=Thalassoglobus neptunius TaxID=1938619 RepID=A0A5C5WXT9_9PLAN|nr:recombinase family protein [Thalassoglobus neptunius]TWT55477.1 hypothetical protein KOR42_28630 [Thalassoglobus neptunius]